MSSDAEMAAVLFGDSAAANPPPPPPPAETPGAASGAEAVRTPRTDGEMAAGLFGEAPAQEVELPVPDEIRTLREADQSRRMFSPQSMYSADIPDDLFGEDAPDIAPEVKGAVVRELREIAADVGLGGADIRGMRNRMVVLQREAPPEAAQREATWTALRAAFGNDAEAALQAAQRFVARDARVGRIIDAMGLGNDAETVVMLAQAARRSVKAR